MADFDHTKIYTGQKTVGGITKPVQIQRDHYAVPYIVAETEDDAWFGLGFAQGQDRAFQLEYYKRQANGALAEIFGERFLNADRYMRIIGIRRTAEKYVPLLDPDVHSMLTAFTAGINAGIFSEDAPSDDGFDLLGIKPTLFDVADVISTQLYFSLSLTHWLGKLTRFLLLERESPEVVKKLDPEYADWNYVTKPIGVEAGPEVNSLYQELVEAKKLLNTKGASNNWCVSAARSVNGFPLVANDPHLAADVAAPWYLAHVRGPGFDICGASYPGSPIFYNGHNGHVAWAMTAAFIDNVDLYQEKMNEDQNATLVEDEFYPCEEVVEEISIKGKSSHQEKVLLSRHGPIISSAINAHGHKIAMCATWFKPKPILGFLRIHKTTDIHQVRDAFKDWPLTSTNLVMSDVKGNIAWQLCGEIPDRKKTRGMLPMPGWDSAYDWNETIIPYEKNPHLINPPEGFIATANNKHTNLQSEPYTGHDFIDGYRHRRIINLLRSREKWDRAHMIEMQGDRFSGPWQDIRDAILKIQPSSEKVAKATSILAAWDGIMTPDSVATLIHEFFIAEMTNRIVKEAAPNSWELVYETFNPAVGSACFAMSRISQVIQLIREQPKDWFNGKWHEILNEAMEKAIGKIESELGEETSRWQWGEYRPLILKHPILRNLKEMDTPDLQKRMNLGPVTWGGNEQTLNVAAGSILDPKVTPDFIPNLRSVIEVGNWSENYFSLAGGQSSNPASPHYRDLFDMWKDGKGIKIAWNNDDIADRTATLMELLPR